MITTRSLAARLRCAVILPLAIAAIVLTGGGPFGAPVLDAQGPPEAQLQRLRSLFELAGVVFTDVDERSGRLVVGVLDRGVQGLIRARLAVLGVRADSVDVVETEPIVQVSTLRDRIDRPVPGGVQIRFSNYLCSLGFNATLDGVDGFVTASHCSTKQGSVDGTKYYQPLNQVAGDLIGTEVADPAYRRNIPGCPKGRVCRWSDANFSAGGDGLLGKIAKTDGVNTGSLNMVAEQFTITGEGAAVVGQSANKVGRSTGWTQGEVSKTCVDTGVSGTNIILLCQDWVENQNAQIVVSGDSGSPVFKIISGNNVTLLGNLWGGNTSGTQFIYSPIVRIRQELGDSLSTH